ncbi:tumor necrosis factor receptor superfamily member 11A isoform X1 [Alligator mississippiensis]|uniref:Tumor necrosis factor receptor superfamily member 5 n=1 Tax=Alligator mississippiensis TaxID=8496 RepID=A0A151NFD7_ALLMI|nr:tumor necrosis factor receptor superfamily member 11A isoform X1 [Alligator mississippiensis]KYO35536.1 tumor necrosis factor receptor superfamily member 11A [Alligator mississippiensis]
MPISAGWWLVLLGLFATDKQLSLQIVLPCESEQYYEYAGRCCTKCEPGKYMSAKCTATSETACQPCGPNEYMDTWNEEDKCLLHKICDKGKGLEEVNPGNRTFQRQCACHAGYHWDDAWDGCKRNTICTPGFGVEHPVQQDKDTICKPCLPGYYSAVSSPTEGCKSWTNCTALGFEVRVPGTTRSDAVCEELKRPNQPEDTNKIFYVLIVVPVLVALIGIIILIVYYKNKGKALTADLQHWANQLCRQIKGKKESPKDPCLNPNMANTTRPQRLEGMYLLAHADSSCSEDACCPNGHALCRNSSPDAIHYESGENTTLSLVTELEDDRFRQGPMEDEYVDRAPHATGYFPLLSQSDSKSLSPFSGPLEVGENDSLSQCFTGTESMVDLAGCYSSDAPYGADCIHASSDKSLQQSCNCTYTHVKETENKDTDHFWMYPDSGYSCKRCGVSCRESPRKGRQPHCSAVGSTTASPENGPYPCACGLDFLSAGQSTLASDQGIEDDSSDSPDTKHQKTNRSTSGANCNTSDLPLASGNVTGNSNSTFISSGQVMNFKGDIIVVYLSQNSQEGPTTTGAANENVGSPVQEENLNRCETFAGNTQHYKEKYAEINPTCPVESGGLNSTGEYHRCPGPVAQEENQDCQGRNCCHKGASQPVQEEGRPGQCSEKALL